MKVYKIKMVNCQIYEDIKSSINHVKFKKLWWTQIKRSGVKWKRIMQKQCVNI